MANNFCIKCGSRLGKNDKFCTYCGTKVCEDDLPFKSNHTLEKKELKRIVGGKILLKVSFINELSKNGLDIDNTGYAIRQQVEDEINSGRLKIGGIEPRVHQLIAEYKVKAEKKKAERAKKLQMLDGILDSEEVKSKIRQCNSDMKTVNAIENSLRERINNGENLNEYEIKLFIIRELARAKDEQEKIRIENERRIRKTQENVRSPGGYCGYDCAYCYEEFFDDDGGIVGNFDSGGYTEYYCQLGHPLNFGSYCEDYK